MRPKNRGTYRKSKVLVNCFAHFVVRMKAKRRPCIRPCLEVIWECWLVTEQESVVPWQWKSAAVMHAREVGIWWPQGVLCLYETDEQAFVIMVTKWVESEEEMGEECSLSEKIQSWRTVSGPCLEKSQPLWAGQPRVLLQEFWCPRRNLLPAVNMVLYSTIYRCSYSFYCVSFSLNKQNFLTLKLCGRILHILWVQFR